ncbi:hypothetical protein CFOL_v3_02790 [Cephalotus follicularis]|uniref:WW domain-containing protein n=1 Tax=Cephalotus follicularis TaxID=3775 RepID=A0A1Q3AU72_CEPFO|nr:hypothetical protein CFOL_v3_02790 [Cephalotus follicularis]
MVSFEALLPSNNRETIAEFDNLTKKRKCEESYGEETFDKRLKAENTRSIFDVELHLETPLPSEWQRCLDIQSGEIHFYNTRTQKRTSRDPRASPDPSSPGHMSLDLELNLPCDHSLRENEAHNHHFTKHISSSPQLGLSDLFMLSPSKQKENSGGLTRSPSWLAFEGDQQEMVATVCMRCHMLVMLCKSSPTCPNCKFMHPPDQSPPKLFKQRLSLLC